jgi:soluble lytic murein transglycosylase
LPAARIESGETARFQGDWERSLLEYQTAQQNSADPEIQSAALLGYGRTQCQAGQPEAGLAMLSSLVSNFPGSTHLPYAHFAMAQCLESLARYQEAADAYLNYLIVRSGVVDGYVLSLRAAALTRAGNWGEALVDYRGALNSPGFFDRQAIEVKIGQAHAAVGDHATALGIFQDIYNRSGDEYLRAQMDLLMGQSYSALGQLDQAYAVYQDAVNNYPRSYDSYSALLALVDAGVPVDELNRGLVDYFAGQYGVALAAFDRYLQAGGLDPATALYYTGLTLRALGSFQEAVAVWERVIQNYPDHRTWDQAWEQKAYTQWFHLEDYPSALQTLQDFPAASPAHPRAAEFLFDAALVAERDNQLTLAIELWDRMVAGYPGDSRANRAVFLAALGRYRLTDFASAYAGFQKLLELAQSMSERTSAYLWMGKCRAALGEAASAAAAWELAAGLDPTGYYSERARDLLQNHLPFTPPEQYDLSVDWVAARVEAETWLRTTFGLAAEIDLSTPAELIQDPRFQRGSELWELGLYESARAEFEDLRLAVQDNPANSYRLANHLLSLGSYRQAILSARQTLNLAGMGDAQTLGAPAFFNHVRFGSYYKNLVIPAAVEYGFHPLFLFSVIRQESAFEGFVRSSAGARGLMQIIPATGAEIASDLGWPPAYTADDLYRPAVNIRLGADYLAKWRDNFSNGGQIPLSFSLYAALAAYNGGPGNSIQWQKDAQNDPDLFLELVRFEETRNYIRGIYEIFNIYRRIYDRTPG